MRRTLVALVVLSAVLVVPPAVFAGQSAGPFVIVLQPDGRQVGAFVPAKEPIKLLGSVGPSVSSALPRKDVRTKDGQVISRFWFSGWRTGPAVTVVVAAMIPAPGTPNAYVEQQAGVSWRDVLQLREIARFTLKVGESRAVAEMKTLGLDPMAVRVDAHQPARNP